MSYIRVRQRNLLNIVKYPLFTSKAKSRYKKNQYSFAVALKADKKSIKTAIEQLFDVKVIAVNTAIQPIKKRRVGRFIGKKAQVKRAVVKLAPENSITFFEQ